MKAYNKRYTPTHVLGQSLEAVFSLLMAFISAIVAAVFPILAMKILFSILGVFSFAAAILFFYLGDDVRFLGIKIQNYVDSIKSMSFEVEKE